MHHGTNPAPDCPLAWGTIGWDTDTPQTFWELGDGSGTDTAIALVNVTLYRGRDISQDIDATRAQGQRIRCQLGGQFFCVPPLNTRVLVAIPEPHGLVHGNGTIVQAIDSRGTQIYGTGYQPGDLVMPCLKSKARIDAKGDGSITITNDKATVLIDGSGNVSVSVSGGAKVNLGSASPGDFIALASKVDAELSKIANAFATFIPGTGGASFPATYQPSGSPGPPMPTTQAPVGSSTIGAE